jgi:hypothetical protein
LPPLLSLSRSPLTVQRAVCSAPAGTLQAKQLFVEPVYSCASHVYFRACAGTCLTFQSQVSAFASATRTLHYHTALRQSAQERHKCWLLYRCIRHYAPVGRWTELAQFRIDSGWASLQSVGYGCPSVRLRAHLAVGCPEIRIRLKPERRLLVFKQVSSVVGTELFRLLGYYAAFV